MMNPVNLFAVTIRADIRFANRNRSDNFIVLHAADEAEAKERAQQFFTENGLWNRSGAGTNPRLIGVKLIPADSIFYNGHLYSPPLWKKEAL